MFIDGSRLVIEACVRAGSDVFVGYPISPANWLYRYARERFPVVLAATDEITTLQWMAGFSSTGMFPVTATSHPGYALMVESLNMAFMMELPMLIILVQRLGPATGSATTGAQGDLLVVRGTISGGFVMPVLCPSNFEDCWTLSARCVETAITLRTPVILLTSKEMMMTLRGFDLSVLPAVNPVSRKQYSNDSYLPYKPEENMVPGFVPVGDKRYRVRLNASTHDATGLIRKDTPDAMANTIRLGEKIESRVNEFFTYELDEDGEDTLILTYGITAEAARDAVGLLRSRGKRVSLLILKTLLPVSTRVYDMISKYRHIVIAEENRSGLLREILFGVKCPGHVHPVTGIGRMISPSRIMEVVDSCRF